MPNLTYRTTLSDPVGYAFSSVSMLDIVWPDGEGQGAAPWLLVGGNATGVLSTLRLGEGLEMTLTAQETRPGGGGSLTEGTLVSVEGRDWLVSFDTFARAPRLQDLDDTARPGAMQALRDMSGDLVSAGRMVQVTDGPAPVLVSSGFGGLGLTSHVLRGASGGAAPALETRATLSASAKMDDRGFTDLEVLHLGGQDLVLGLTPGAIQSFSIAADGALTLVDGIASHDGLWTDAMTDMVTLNVDGTDYVAIAAAGSDSISTVRINEMGVFFPVDMMLDTRDTRFGGAQVIETFEHNGRDFLVAAGSDQGVALLEVGAGGLLTHHHSLAHDLAWSLGGAMALSVAVVGAEAQIFVTGAARDGLAQLVVDLDRIGEVITGTAGADSLTGTARGDVLEGGAGDDRIAGGAGDDRILDGDGADQLYGGEGADVFVFAADGLSDRIDDFEKGVDRIDISAWGASGIDALRLIGTGNGAVIRYGDEEIRAFPDPRGWIGPEEWTPEDFIF